jgi:predicted CXXCH cytochrome family protein
VQTYDLYTSPTFVATPGQPGPTSLQCLSCHDGTVASDSFGNGGVLATGSHFITSTNLVGAQSSLKMDHPIGFVFDAALAQNAPHLVTPVSASYVDAAKTVTLYAGKLECASCHSVHDNGNTKFLRIPNTSSAMCIKCHAL